MDYTIENGLYYKVVDKDNGEFITVGMMEESTLLSTLDTVVFITKEEYDTLNPEE